MRGREAARQAAGERLRYPQGGAYGVGPGIGAAEPYGWSGEPTASAARLDRSRGGPAIVPGGHSAGREGARPPAHNPQEVQSELAPVRDGSVPRAHLLWAAAALLLEAIAQEAPGDPDASAAALERDLGRTEPDHVLFPAVIRVALGLLERRAGHDPAEAALAAELASLLGEVKRTAPPPAQPAWPGEPLTESETRMLRYLPTHMGAPEIAAELFLSANTVKTHLRHLYRKLGAHSRQEAVQRARTIGLLTAPSRRPLTAGPGHSSRDQTRSA